MIHAWAEIDQPTLFNSGYKPEFVNNPPVKEAPFQRALQGTRYC